MPEVKDAPLTSLEKAIGVLYSEFYKLRKAEAYQEEYDAMGALLDMLMKDRAFLREKHGSKLKL